MPIIAPLIGAVATGVIGAATKPKGKSSGGASVSESEPWKEQAPFLSGSAGDTQRFQPAPLNYDWLQWVNRLGQGELPSPEPIMDMRDPRMTGQDVYRPDRADIFGQSGVTAGTGPAMPHTMLGQAPASASVMPATTQSPLPAAATGIQTGYSEPAQVEAPVATPQGTQADERYLWKELEESVERQQDLQGNIDRGIKAQVAARPRNWEQNNADLIRAMDARGLLDDYQPITNVDPVTGAMYTSRDFSGLLGEARNRTNASYYDDIAAAEQAAAAQAARDAQAQQNAARESIYGTPVNSLLG